MKKVATSLPIYDDVSQVINAIVFSLKVIAIIIPYFGLAVNRILCYNLVTKFVR